MASLKTFWKDPVASAVIAGLILAIGGSALSTWLKWWPAVGHGLGGAVRWLAESSAIPNWLSIFGGLALAAVIFVIGACNYEQLRQAGRSPSIANYRADRFFGVDWTWQWVNASYDIYNECPLCPTCNYQLDIEHRYGPGRPMTEFRCDSCHRIVATEAGAPDEVRTRLVRLIHQKVRTGAWVAVVSQAG